MNENECRFDLRIRNITFQIIHENKDFQCGLRLWWYSWDSWIFIFRQHYSCPQSNYFLYILHTKLESACENLMLFWKNI